MQTEAERLALLVLSAGDKRRLAFAYQVPDGAHMLKCECGKKSLPVNVTWNIWRRCPGCDRVWCIEE